MSDREEIQTLGLRESTRLIRKILTIEAQILGGKWDRFVFGQGAATAAHTLLILQIPKEARDGTLLSGGLDAFLGFSSRMPHAGGGLAETRTALNLYDVPEDDVVIQKTPVLLGHCINDQIMRVENGRVLHDTLQGFGAHVH